MFLLHWLLGFSLIAQTSPHPISQKRLSGETYVEAAERHLRLSTREHLRNPEHPDAYESRTDFASLNFENLPIWHEATQVFDEFYRIRDLRFIVLRDRPDFKRRISWLYPDDGCFARAEAFNGESRKMGDEIPGKIFIFGDLQVKTANSPYGYVEWWYHVVPAVIADGITYVFDPAIDAQSPLELKGWVNTMTSDLSRVQLSVCKTGAYDPDSACDSTEDLLNRAIEDENRYLHAEWGRIEAMHRNPEEELGEYPPWRPSNE